MSLRILTGPTASGKAAVAVHLAGMIGAELISVDSIKVYRGLDIGTAKPSLAVRESVPFHMVDVVDSRDAFTLARYLTMARAALADITARGRPALFVGGTPLYLRGLLYGIFEGPGADWPLRAELAEKARREGSESLHAELRRLDPTTADRLHPNDVTRIIRALEVIRATGRPLSEHQRQFPAAKPAVEYRMVALRRDDADLRERVDRRVERMFAEGIVEETRRAVEQGLNRSAQKAIGYREVIAHLNGEMDLAETVAAVKRNTWRLARKQRAWTRSFPGVVWLDVPREETPQTTAARAHEYLFGRVSDN